MMYMPGVTVKDLQAAIDTAPKEARCQLAAVKDYLMAKIGVDKVGTLYGFRRTGKTSLMQQAIRWLIQEQGVSRDEIFYATVVDPDRAQLSDILQTVQEGNYQYVFLDEISYCSDFLSGSAGLYEALTNKAGRRILITGTNLFSIFVAEKRNLFNRTLNIPVQHLSFYEYCKFKGIPEPQYSDFNYYLRYGGLFEELDAFEYVTEAVVQHVISTILDEDIHSVYAWYSKSEYRDYMALAHNILLNAVGQNINQKIVSRAYAFKRDLNEFVLNPVIRDKMQEYLRLNDSINRSIKKDELKAFMEVLEHCGLLLVLNNIIDKPMEGDISKCYITFPFIRYAYTMRLARMAGISDPELKGEFLGALTEACAISEYRMAHPKDKIYFWRERVEDIPLECDLVVTNYKEPKYAEVYAAYELKASMNSNRGQRGYEKMSDLHPEFGIPRSSCYLVGGEDVMRWVYLLGKGRYPEAGQMQLDEAVLASNSGNQRTSVFGNTNGWRVGP